MNEQELFIKIDRLMQLYHAGFLGGEKMPEDENPGLGRASYGNYVYFTLPMALNYQRNSYKLWESAHRTFCDPATQDVFLPSSVCGMSFETLKNKLTRYQLALQPNKQPEIWKRLSMTFCREFDGDIRELFIRQYYSVKNIKAYILNNKHDFPYLSGNKILNYWLYVISRYTDTVFSDRQALTIAPDTHIIQASERLGIITCEEKFHGDIQNLVAARWASILTGTQYTPIDLHTPMWLWSRGKFQVTLS